jgi:hypothetical protein
MTLFDLAEAEKRRDEGIARAANRRQSLLAEAQAIARGIALARGEVDSDMVAREMEAVGVPYAELGNASGAVFRAPPVGWRWEWTGRTRRSERVSTHARILRIWHLVREDA